MSPAEAPDRTPAHQPSLVRELSMVLVLAAAAFSLTPWCTPQLALGAGIILAIAGLVPREIPTQELAKFLIQIAVVLLGFKLNLGDVVKAGIPGILLAATAIGCVLLLGWVLKRSLRVERDISAMITTGTAICGGSAIAALSSAIRASASATAVALATVFVLNAAALYLYPWIGQLLDLTPRQFGAWAGIAIHDFSSVVGAASEYDRIRGGGETMAMAVVVKMCRIIWLVPLVMVMAWSRREPAAAGARNGLPIPWFVLLFLLASILHTLIPAVAEAAPAIESASKLQLRLALFLIGTGLSLQALRTVGWRALAQGMALWLFLGASSLLVIRAIL
jgi:uncharacterized integral membrane protein (TIGR00698 family)